MPGGTIRQVHGDGHLGLEAARKMKFPASRRVLDYAHLIGSTSSPATIPAHDDADGEKRPMYRKGIFSTLSEASCAEIFSKKLLR